MDISGTLSKIVKAYDVRGRYPEELNEQVARRIGAGFAKWLLTTASTSDIIIAGDMRPSTPGIIEALAEGIKEQGADAIVAGLSSTDQLYFASGHYGLPGIMVTASHNPAAYNGLKLCRAYAAPIGETTGLGDITRLAAADLPPAAIPGRRRDIDTLQAYADHLHALVPLGAIRPLRVVVDAANGMAGLTVPAVLGSTPITVIPMYFELDGTFPNHPADPLNPDNLRDLQAAVREHGADLGLAFDGDADRCFVVDERGEPVSPSAITALIADRELATNPGAAIVHNVITSSTVAQTVTASGGRPVRTKVGHSNMKAAMAAESAIFGGEHSAHYYFREFWNADTGMLAAMHILAARGGTDAPLSNLVAPYSQYAASGEINSEVADVPAALRQIRAQAVSGGASIDELDGITAIYDDGAWVNVRASNTEPLLRLNVEAPDPARMAALRDEALATIRAEVPAV